MPVYKASLSEVKIIWLLKLYTFKSQPEILTLSKYTLKNDSTNCRIVRKNLKYIRKAYIIVIVRSVKQIIAKNLVELRKYHKLTQMELGEKLNYSDKAISRWEQGETLPDIDVLCQLADLYGVSFEYLIREGSMQDKRAFMTKKERENKLTITLLAISLVWFLATIIFVYSNLIFSYNFWQVFIWAIPLSMIIAIIFNSIWGKRKYTFWFISILVWSALASFYLQLIQYNIWLVFILGVPVQIAVILWSTMKKY